MLNKNNVLIDISICPSVASVGNKVEGENMGYVL